jgi:hypothetical protein
MQRIGSGFFWNQLNTLYVREGACKVRVDGAEDKPAPRQSIASGPWR